MLDGAVSNSHSWWWGSHVSPKHSRWLKENLADMDLKVKDMLKLIEEDADSFAKRAEMYYKKRPELLSLVEEFYRTYRALTERYDHITGELHQVQCSMGNAFPNQLQNEMDSFSPQASILNKQNQDHVGKELEGFGAVMEDRGHECVESKETAHASACLKETGEIDFNELTKLQKEISSLHQEKEKLKTECEKGVHEVRVVQEQLLQMQVELHHVQEENHKLTGNSSSYVAQISELRDQVSVLKRQNDAYVEEVEVVSQKLQFELQEKNKLIMEIQRLEVKLHDLERQTEVKSECSTPDQGSNRKKFANLQDDLFKLHHENHNLRMQVMTGVQQLQKANEEIQKLHHSLLKSQAENDTMILQYQQSLKLYESAEIRAKDLQIRMGFLQEENRRIRDEIAGAVLRMKITEGAHNLERENNAFQQNIWHRIQRTDFLQGLRAKQDEVQNLGMGILDETQQIVNFDAVIRNYQQSLSQSQEQQNKLSAELQDGNERLKDAEKRIKVLEEEIHNLHREKDNLKEESSSAVVSIKNLEQEVYKLKQEKNNLLNEVAFRLDQRDALQQELYCLKEDRNDLDRKYQTIMKQIESWGLDVASIRSVFASLQYIRQKLREHRQIHEDENVTLLQVLQKMEELLKRTVILENLATSHQLEADKLEFEMKHLKHHVEDLQKEKAELLDETKHQYGRIRNLEEKLEDANILYSQLQKESQQHEYELADALDCMKHLNIQICSLQGEKEILQNETVESTLQMSYAQKQVDLLKEEVKDLKNKLDEEINKEQKSETEIKKLKQIMCEMDNRNQTLSDDYHTLDEKFGAVEEKVKELEETTLKQQIENDMLLHNLSSAIEFNRELEPDIQKLQKLLGVSCNAEGKLGNDGAEATKMLKSIVVQVKNLQKELTHFQEENQNLLNDALAKKTDLEQLQRNIFVLSAEKESIKEEAVFGLENIASLQKENSQLQAVIDSQRINLEAGLEREGTLILEIRSLQQSLKSSVSAHLALEGEYQRILEEHNSMKACLKESESKLLKTEEENQTLLIEALSQVSLVSLLESLIVEKDENMQIMEEQLNSFQENISKVECWLQSGGSTPQMREAEIWQLQEFTGGFREEEQGIVQGTLDVVHGLDKQLDLQIQKGANQVRGRGENVGELCLEGTTLEMTEKELQQEVPILTEEGLQLKYHVPVKYDIKIMHDLQEEKQREDDKISCRSIQKRELHAMPMETQAQGGKPRKPGEQQQDLIMKAERHYESPKSSLSEKTYFEDEHWKNDDGDTLLTVASAVYGSDARREVQDCKSQVPELQNLITDLQQENIELKCHRWKKNSVETIKGKEYPQDKEQNSKLRLEERHLDIHDDKDGLFDEERGGESIEENFRHDICCLQELNQKLWNRFDSATQQFSKLQINFQELQEKFWKTRLDNKKATADGQKGKQTNDTEKQLQELQDELLVWLECNDMLTKEAQNRFATAHRLQAELAAAKGGQSGDKCEETESASSQEEKLQNEVLSIEEESSKIADMLQAGSDQARALEFEVEKILLKFQGERKILSIEQHKKAHIPRVRTSLRTFLFGKEEQRQKRRGAWVCMHPVINE